VGRLLGIEALGQFSVGQHLARIPLDKGTSMLTQVAYPAFSRLAATEGRGRSQLTRLIGLNSAIFLPLMWITAAIAMPVLPVLLGPQWSTAAPAFAVFAIVVPLQMTQSLMHLAVTAVGRADVVQRNSAVSMVLTIGGVGVGVGYGIEGAVAGWALGYLAGWFVATAQSADAVGIRVSSVIGAALSPAVPTLLALVFVGISLYALGIRGELPWSLFGGATALGAAYAGFAMLDPKTTREMFGLIRRLFSVQGQM
jgi:O-antigen/teichoic acid export membrane protein